MKVSIVLPVYNVEAYIAGCLRSITNQDFQDFEVLLVDDGSPDGSIDAAKEYLKGTDLDWHIIDKENGGVSSARNAGLRESKGDYVVFVDPDDVLSSDFLSSLANEMKEETDFVFCGYQYVKEQNVPVDRNDKKEYFNREELLDHFLKRTVSFVLPSMLFKRSFLIDNGLFFEEKIHFSEDQLYMWNVILHSDQTVYLHKKMYGYYLRESSTMTGSSLRKITDGYREFKSYIETYFEAYPQYKEIKERLLPRWELGALYTSARITEYEDFRKIYEEMNGKTVFRRLQGIGEIKAYLLGIVCSISPKLLYRFCRRMDLNG
ncbi:MAG: glycosyltransferase family 2 protein [Erysipelotrichaceae bacterium]|nr:glycosyltransferase family 2 protein [Erysipelotrichaceae bacterium]